MAIAASSARASTITCGFGGNPNGPGCLTQSTDERLFNFGPYLVDLTFDNVHGPFSVSITDVFTSQGQLIQEQRLDGFQGYTCVPLDLTNCVEFEVNAPSPGPGTWTGFYDLAIVWQADTNADFPNDPGNRIRILHNRGDVPGNGFDTDITVDGSYIVKIPGAGGDPGIGGRDDNFQSFLVAQAPAVVPEPATLLLIGSGVAWAARRRLS
jgi:hypothetical protein